MHHLPACMLAFDIFKFGLFLRITLSTDRQNSQVQYVPIGALRLVVIISHQQNCTFRAPA